MGLEKRLSINGEQRWWVLPAETAEGRYVKLQMRTTLVVRWGI